MFAEDTETKPKLFTDNGPEASPPSALQNENSA
jgi:hypothetical protein